MNKNVSNDNSLVVHKNYGDILASSNEILNSENSDATRVGHNVRKSVLGKTVYLAMVARFSNINSLITGLTCVMCRVRKIDRGHAGNWHQVAKQAWDKLMRSSQLYYPPENIKQMFPELDKCGVLSTKNRLSDYSLIKYHKSGGMGIISHKDTNLCRILLQRVVATSILLPT